VASDFLVNTGSNHFERRLAMHRAVTIRLDNGGFHWHQLCDCSQPKYGVGLTWDNSEVTCENCLNVLNDSKFLPVSPTASFKEEDIRINHRSSPQNGR
jgi:hypothetical protein